MVYWYSTTTPRGSLSVQYACSDVATEVYAPSSVTTGAAGTLVFTVMPSLTPASLPARRHRSP